MDGKRETMSEQLDLSIVIPAPQQQVYNAWLDSDAHSAFTGSPADIDPTVGGIFNAWDGYISGKTLELEPYERIYQSWRTTDFPTDAPDSYLEVLFEASEQGTLLTLRHTNIPDGQADQYEEGWQEYYFKPMMTYFKKA
jgi:activator of HSP90 ATPase